MYSFDRESANQFKSVRKLASYHVPVAPQCHHPQSLGCSPRSRRCRPPSAARRPMLTACALARAVLQFPPTQNPLREHTKGGRSGGGGGTPIQTKERCSNHSLSLFFDAPHKSHSVPVSININCPIDLPSPKLIPQSLCLAIFPPACIGGSLLADKHCRSMFLLNMI